MVEGPHPGRRGRPDLAADVDRARRILADEHHCEAWRHAARGQRADRLGDATAEVAGEALPSIGVAPAGAARPSFMPFRLRMGDRDKAAARAAGSPATRNVLSGSRRRRRASRTRPAAPGPARGARPPPRSPRRPPARPGPSASAPAGHRRGSRSRRGRRAHPRRHPDAHLEAPRKRPPGRPVRRQDGFRLRRQSAPGSRRSTSAPGR